MDWLIKISMSSYGVRYLSMIYVRSYCAGLFDPLLWELNVKVSFSVSRLNTNACEPAPVKLCPVTLKHSKLPSRPNSQIPSLTSSFLAVPTCGVNPHENLLKWGFFQSSYKYLSLSLTVLYKICWWKIKCAVLACWLTIIGIINCNYSLSCQKTY